MRRLFRILVAGLALAAPAVAAWAFWTVGGTGEASALSSNLDPPQIGVPDNSNGPVTVGWSEQAALVPASPASGSITYTVERRLGSGAFAPVSAGGCGGALPHGMASCIDTPPASGTYTYRVVASLDSWTAVSLEAGPVTVTLDTTPPSVQAINRADADPTNSASVSWTVTFSEPVTGVEASDFQLASAGGVTGGSISSVTGSGATRTVTASTGTGSGTLGLNLVDDDTIRDAAGNPLGGTGAGNGNFTGQVYTIEGPLCDYRGLAASIGGLVGYWALDDTAGTTVAATVGPAGTLSGSYTLNQTGAFSVRPGCSGTAIRFPSGQASFGNTFGFTGTASFSVAVWIKPHSPAPASGNWANVIGNQRLSPHWGWWINRPSNNQPRFERWSNGASLGEAWWPCCTMTNETWYHVVGTFNNASGEPMKLYVNGAPRVDLAPGGSIAAHTDPLRIGGPGIGPGNTALNSTIDEVAIWNKELTSAQVQQLYDAR